ncbi:MAG: hypothetical protein ACYDEG_08635, partial [bacterium]
EKRAQNYGAKTILKALLRGFALSEQSYPLKPPAKSGMGQKHFFVLTAKRKKSLLFLISVV